MQGKRDAREGSCKTTVTMGCIAFHDARPDGVCGGVSGRAAWLLITLAHGGFRRTLWIQKETLRIGGLHSR